MIAPAIFFWFFWFGDLSRAAVCTQQRLIVNSAALRAIFKIRSYALGESCKRSMAVLKASVWQTVMLRISNTLNRIRHTLKSTCYGNQIF